MSHIQTLRAIVEAGEKNGGLKSLEFGKEAGDAFLAALRAAIEAMEGCDRCVFAECVRDDIVNADGTVSPIAPANPYWRNNVGSAPAGREYGGAQQAGRDNSLQSVKGSPRCGVGTRGAARGRACDPNSTPGSRQDSEPGAGA